jgi:putative ABC transport system permease protein
MMANKLRTFLTMFGIAWGVGSLLVLVGLGEGFRSGQRRNLASVGNDVIMMFSATIPRCPTSTPACAPTSSPSGRADIAAARSPRRRHRHLNRADLYEVSAWSNTSSQVFGVEPNFPTCASFPRRRPLHHAADLTNRRRVAVLGLKSAHIALSRPSLLGETITINGTSFTVVGRVGTIAAATTTSTTRRSTFPSPPCRSSSP